ncbi:dual specificity mitogen-activated protein kinase kinase 6-like [Diaphorina citri]|uniref:mitogen-activated protein kinase kinase n=1 Tax=Diaphorina citri TaxID=121845 RepID=A0A3Q0ITM0_DIACI|nr:dual specificity mitogen-activated protein kinase kinase 6-like [Diaphorina citri]
MVKEKYPDIKELVQEEDDEDGNLPFIENIINTKKGSSRKRIYLSKVGEEMKMREILSKYTMRSIRAVFNPDEIGVTVSSVKTTDDKKVVLVTGKGEAEKVQKELETLVKGIDTKISGRANTQVVVLDVYKNNRSIPENILSTITSAVLNALHYLHSKLQVIHRDVKPSNILINRAGDVKMCDFGISGYLVDSVAKTIDAGCKPYMAIQEATWGALETVRGGKPNGEDNVIDVEMEHVSEGEENEKQDGN